MTTPEKISDLPQHRQEVAHVDFTINGARSSIQHQDSHLRLIDAKHADDLYDEPSYNSDVYSDLKISSPFVNILASATLLLVEAENLRSSITNQMPAKEAALFKRVPDFTYYRATKAGYRDLPINTNHEKTNEQVVPLGDYGVESQAYYSRPNKVTGEAIPGVNPDVFTRLSLAKKLQWVNEALAQDHITEFFGGRVELHVAEGWRDPVLQKALNETLIPEHTRKELRRDRPELSEEEIEKEVDKVRSTMIARASRGASDSPAPHESGGAADLRLQFADTKEPIPMGRENAQMTTRTNPDHFEENFPQNDADMIAAQNLRALRAIMTGAAFGEETGLEVNPTEFWHWSIGDQLNYVVTGVEPYYSFAPKGVSTYEPES